MGDVTTNFSKEEEEILRQFIFTNPNGKDSFIYPQQLFSGEEFSPLLSEYSRTHKYLQDRVLSYIDREKTAEAKVMLPMIPEIIAVTRNPDGSLKSTKKTEGFNRTWILRKGHMSAKELTGLVGYSEDISDIVDKHITGHPLVSPLVKSTRYLSFDNIVGKEDSDIASLPNPEKFFEYVKYMGKRYIEATEKLADFVFKHRYKTEVVNYLRRPENIERAAVKWAEEQSFVRGFPVTPAEIAAQHEKILDGLKDEKVRDEINTFVLDYSRVYLLSSIKNSLGYALDARSLAEAISCMLSSTRIEDRTRGQAIWDEAKKIAPVLFNSPESIKLNSETGFGNWVRDNVVMVYHPGREELVHIYSQTDRKELPSDTLNAALALYPHLDASLTSILFSVRHNPSEILKKAHEGLAGKLNQDISHSGLMVETVMPWHAYRDIYRHRRGQHTRQLLSTRLGYEVPILFEMAGLSEQYAKDMENAKGVYEDARKTDPAVAEKLVPFGFNVRALHSWPLNQIVYVAGLRGNYSVGNRSYVKMARALMAETRRLFPETMLNVKSDEREYPAELWKRGYEWWDKEGRPKTFK